MLRFSSNKLTIEIESLYSSLSSFSSKDTIEYFESHNVKLVTERGNRVFPASYHASDITKALLNTCLDNNVKINYLENEIVFN